MSAQPVDILITGGGPVGLSLANFATKLGLSVRVVEQTAEIHRQGRADSLNARSIEIYEQASPNLSATILNPALKYSRYCIYSGGRLTNETLWQTRHCKIDHNTFLPQYLIESVLQGHLRSQGVTVERPKVLTDFEILEDNDVAPIRAIVKHEQTGEEEIVTAMYMVGCDGGKSFTRRKLTIPLVGNATELSCYIMDNSYIQLGIPTRDLSCNIIQSDVGNIIVVPVGKDLYRTVVQVKGETPGQQSLNQKEVLQFAKNVVKPFNIEFGEIFWFTYYSIKELVATEFSAQNRIFLAGDAGHVHGPGGGLGLNTGIADAYDLAWKLYFAKHNLVGPDFLNFYHDERHDIAEKVIELSGLIMRLQLQIAGHDSSPSGLNSTAQKELRHAWAKNNGYMTGLEIEYALSPLCVRDSVETLAFSQPFKIQASQRFPDAKVISFSSISNSKETKFFYDHWTYAPTFRVVILAGDLSVTSTTLSSFAQYLESPVAFPQKYPSPTPIPLFATYVILRNQNTASPSKELEATIVADASDEEGFYSILGVDPAQGAIFIVRPDNMIGCAVALEDFDKLEVYFDGFLVAAK